MRCAAYAAREDGAAAYGPQVERGEGRAACRRRQVDGAGCEVRECAGTGGVRCGARRDDG